jgi:hypothetical protein
MKQQQQQPLQMAKQLRSHQQLAVQQQVQLALALLVLLLVCLCHLRAGLTMTSLQRWQMTQNWTRTCR